MSVQAGPKVLVKGGGEQASATAHRLFRCGYSVVMTEVAQPTAIRLPVSFCTAIYEGTIEVEGVRAIGYRLQDADRLADLDHTHIPVFVDPQGALLDRWHPDVVIDGRIAKRNLDNTLRDAPLVIGLGPGLEAGRDVHVVIETNRGHDLGRIIEDGLAAANTGVPGTIAGRTGERVLRAPGAGLLERRVDIGALVTEGQIVLTVEGTPVISQLDGVVRGLTRSGLIVVEGQKIGDVDPRGERRACVTISEKARTISGAVLEVVLTRAGAPGGRR